MFLNSEICEIKTPTAARPQFPRPIGGFHRSFGQFHRTIIHFHRSFIAFIWTIIYLLLTIITLLWTIIALQLIIITLPWTIIELLWSFSQFHRAIIAFHPAFLASSPPFSGWRTAIKAFARSILRLWNACFWDYAHDGKWILRRVSTTLVVLECSSPLELCLRENGNMNCHAVNARRSAASATKWSSPWAHEIKLPDKLKDATFLLSRLFLFWTAKEFCPAGTTENSPQFQLREKAGKQIKPRRGGRRKWLREIRPPLRGLCVFVTSNPQLKLRAIFICASGAGLQCPAV